MAPDSPVPSSWKKNGLSILTMYDKIPDLLCMGRPKSHGMWGCTHDGGGSMASLSSIQQHVLIDYLDG